MHDRPSASAAGSMATLVVANAIVFSSSLCIMVIELAAARLVARNLGSSLYTWTSVIGVILGGISLGNYLGGHLADRFNPRRLLPTLFMAASVLSLSVLWLNQLMGKAERPEMLSWPIWVLLSVASIFMLPACALGTISPVVAKAALMGARHTGATVGNIYAWGAIGSIVGTFLAGFVLIDQLGTRGIVWTVAAGLALISLLLAATRIRQGQPGGKPWLVVLGVWVLALGGASGPVFGWWDWADQLQQAHADADPTSMPARLRGLFLDSLSRTAQRRNDLQVDESNYYYISVREGGDSPDTRVLVLDYLVHSYVPLDDPTRLEYEYEQIYAAITRQLAAPGQPLRTFFVGGGGFVFPRYIEKLYPDSRIDVAEIDPAVKRMAQVALGLPPDDKTLIRTHLMDARNYVDDLLRRGRAQSGGGGGSPVQYDFIYGDAFNDFSVPWHLTTREFNERIRRLLAPEGVYLVNIIDILPAVTVELETAPPLFAGVPEKYRDLFAYVPLQSDPETGGDGGSDDAAERPMVELRFRGIMSPEQREELLALSSDPAYQKAIRKLEANSRRQAAGGFLGAFTATALQTFPCVYVFSTHNDGPSGSRDTFVIACSGREINLDKLGLGADGTAFKGSCFAWSERGRQFGLMPAVLKQSRGIILTDDYAPVDNLLAPVFRERGE